jgi:spore maturation protein CgeB
LLIGQYCEDLESLGFNSSNALIFNKKDFFEKVNYYRNHSEEFIQIRENGRELIKTRHKLSDRINTIRKIFYEE